MSSSSSSSFDSSSHQAFNDNSKVIFAGQDIEPAAGPKDYNFGIYVPSGETAYWLPAVTSEPSVIEKLQGMEIGQVFKILSQRNEGAMTTRINALRPVNDAPIYDVERHGPLSIVLNPKK